jgi:hypothetical protein
VQDAFAHALRAAAQVRDDRAWPAWLRTVAIRCYLRSVARQGGGGDEGPAVSILTMADVPDLHTAADPAAEAQLRLQEEAVLALLAGLTPQQRRVFAPPLRRLEHRGDRDGAVYGSSRGPAEPRPGTRGAQALDHAGLGHAGRIVMPRDQQSDRELDDLIRSLRQSFIAGNDAGFDFDASGD